MANPPSPRRSRILDHPADSSTSASLLADYATTPELAAEFGVSPRTVERWINLRLIPPPVRLGRKVLHHRPTIREHLLALTCRPTDKGRRR